MNIITSQRPPGDAKSTEAALRIALYYTISPLSLLLHSFFSPFPAYTAIFEFLSIDEHLCKKTENNPPTTEETNPPLFGESFVFFYSVSERWAEAEPVDTAPRLNALKSLFHPAVFHLCWVTLSVSLCHNMLAHKKQYDVFLKGPRFCYLFFYPGLQWGSLAWLTFPKSL